MYLACHRGVDLCRDRLHLTRHRFRRWRKICWRLHDRLHQRGGHSLYRLQDSYGHWFHLDGFFNGWYDRNRKHRRYCCTISFPIQILARLVSTSSPASLPKLINSFPGLWTLFAMLVVSAFMTCFLWWKIGSSSEYRGTGSVERFEEFAEVQEDKEGDGKIKAVGTQAPEFGESAGAVEVRGVELDSEGRQRD